VPLVQGRRDISPPTLCPAELFASAKTVPIFKIEEQPIFTIVKHLCFLELANINARWGGFALSKKKLNVA
jgi:hypothetical protein